MVWGFFIEIKRLCGFDHGFLVCTVIEGMKIDALYDKMKKEDEVKRAAEIGRLIQLKNILYLLTGIPERPSVFGPSWIKQMIEGSVRRSCRHHFSVVGQYCCC